MKLHCCELPIYTYFKASENSKNHDTCKEVKNLMDGGLPDPDIPDGLLARLLKLKLIALKQEGLDIRNSVKVVKVLTKDREVLGTFRK